MRSALPAGALGLVWTCEYSKVDTGLVEKIDFQGD